MTGPDSRGRFMWENRTIRCAEQERQAELLLEWERVGDAYRLRGVSCDHPGLSGLEPWDCRWSCWKAIEYDARPIGES